MKVPRKKPAAGKKSPPAKKPSSAKKPLGAKKPSPGKSPSPATKKASAKKSGKKADASKQSVSAKAAKEPGAELAALVGRLRAQLDMAENQDCIWVVELVIPPGIFMARRMEGPIDHAALNREIAATTVALQKGNDPERHRFLITKTDVGGVARQYAKAMCEDIPNPTVPMDPNDLFTIDAILHAQFIGDEEY